MIYQSSSIKEVIGNVIRNTRVQDMEFITSLPEWIGEAMSFMRTRMELIYKFNDVDIDFHIGSLPAGTVAVEAVEYNGMQLRNLRQRMKSYDRCYPQSIRFTEWKNLPYCTDKTFYTEMGFIKTNFSSGCVRLHCLAIPTDEDDFPLIPDNANYKQALYWHCRAMMIGAGYEDKIFSYAYCDAEFEKYAARAIGEINYPSVESMDAKIPDITRFLPGNYLSFFGISGGNGCGSSAFAMLPPTSKTDMYVETITITNTTVIPGMESFTYNALGTEGNTVTLTELIGKGITSLHLDAYELTRAFSDADLNPNTFLYDIITGTITVANELTVGQILQGLKADALEYTVEETGDSIQLDALKGKEIVELYINYYILDEVEDLSDLNPNTFIFDSTAGRITFSDPKGPGELLYVLHKPKP